MSNLVCWIEKRPYALDVASAPLKGVKASNDPVRERLGEGARRKTEFVGVLKNINSI